MVNKTGLIATTVFAVVLAGTIGYSVIERSHINHLVRQETQTQTLKGFASVDGEPFLKDARVQKILADHKLRIEITQLLSREMASKVSVAPDAPQFFLSAGTLAAQRITDAAKRLNITTTTYSPLYSPLIVASWEPVAQILTSNGAAIKSGDRVYDLDLATITDFMLQKKRWKDLQNHEGYDVSRSVLITTTDPRTSNSGTMYLALASHALNGHEVVTDRETARRLAGQIAELYKRQGYLEHSSDKIIQDYLSIGMGKVPLAFLYEFQIVAAKTLGNRSIPADVVLLYPKPTIFNKQVFVALNNAAKTLGELLSTDPELQKIAVEYGFRGSDAASFRETAGRAGFSVKDRVVDVVDPPTQEIMDEMIEVVTPMLR
ncbi:MAG: substrate-binding domain-containing protein [Candidatus Competibacter sp.]|nr:substrate-binding domain-containing protein [Candidatus Competibacter sp.]MDS4057750.1 substrate-binding domain-containing protein [Candidatus Contendobacter sp.]